MTAPTTFWARRRAAVEAETRAEETVREAALRAEEQAELEAKSDAELLEELGLPDPEELQAGDDFSAFMTKAVPDRLRRRALRVLWRSNPVLANIDNLVDYGEDFTDSALVVENLQTTYQVGKGMLKHIEKLAEAEAAAEAKAEADAASDEADIDAPVETETPVALAEVADAPTPADDAAPDDDMAPDDIDEPTAPAPRRMTFAFEADTA